MTDFLSSLVSRSFGAGASAAIRPRVASLFEPAFPQAELPADVSHPRETYAAGGEPEGPQTRAELTLRDEPATQRRLTYRPEPYERAALGPVAVPDSRPAVPAASAVPAPRLQMTRVPVEEETRRPRREPERRGEEVAPARAVTSAARSSDRVRPEPAETVAIRKESTPSEERGLLVPPKTGARIAGALQSTVSASQITSRDRDTGPQRAAVSRHASQERNVHVTIGRIEVRATAAEKTPVRERSASPVMGLDEYLRRQSRRGGQ